MGHRRYFIRKDTKKAGKAKEWIEMEGDEFYRFLHTKEAKARYFIRLKNDGDEDCDVIYMEASDKDFRNWKANDNHQRYYRKYTRGRGYKKVSMSAHADEDGLLVEEVVASGDEMTEELAIRGLQVETLYHAMDLLSNAERKILDMYYWKGMGQQEIAEALNTSQPNIRQRLRRIHKKLAGLMKKF